MWRWASGPLLTFRFQKVLNQTAAVNLILSGGISFIRIVVSEILYSEISYSFSVHLTQSTRMVMAVIASRFICCLKTVLSVLRPMQWSREARARIMGLGLGLFLSFSAYRKSLFAIHYPEIFHKSPSAFLWKVKKSGYFSYHPSLLTPTTMAFFKSCVFNIVRYYSFFTSHSSNSVLLSIYCFTIHRYPRLVSCFLKMALVIRPPVIVDTSSVIPFTPMIYRMLPFQFDYVLTKKYTLLI